MRVVPAQQLSGPKGGRFNLEPLKIQGESALNCSDIPGLTNVVLREIHLFRHNHRHQSIARIAPNVFRAYAFEDKLELFPLDCEITRLVLDFYFTNSPAPRSVTFEPPFDIMPESSLETDIILRWAACRGFLLSTPSPENPDEQAMAIA